MCISEWSTDNLLREQEESPGSFTETVRIAVSSVDLSLRENDAVIPGMHPVYLHVTLEMLQESPSGAVNAPVRFVDCPSEGLNLSILQQRHPRHFSW